MSDTLYRYGITPEMSAQEVAESLTNTMVVYTLDEDANTVDDLAAILTAREAQARAQGIEQGRREAWEILSAECGYCDDRECLFDRCPLMREA